MKSLKRYKILNHLGYEVGFVDCEDETIINPIAAYAAKISNDDCRVSFTSLYDAGYKFALVGMSPD